MIKIDSMCLPLKTMKKIKKSSKNKYKNGSNKMKELLLKLMKRTRLLLIYKICSVTKGNKKPSELLLLLPNSIQKKSYKKSNISNKPITFLAGRKEKLRI